MERRNPYPPAASYLAGLASSALASLAAIGASGAETSSVTEGDHARGAQLGAGSLVQPVTQPAVPANLVRAELMPALVRMPGGGEAIAIAVTVAPEWHIYWKNPGDTGAAPTAKIELPAGWTSGALAFPRPEVFGDADERTFGYSGTVHLMIPVTRPGAWQGGVSVKGELSWLACKRSCVAGRSPLSGQVLADAAASVDAPSERAWPMPLPAGSDAVISGEGAARILSVSVAGVAESEKVQFIPDDCTGIRWGGGTGPFGLQWDAQKRLWTLKTSLSVTPGDAPGHAPRARGLVLVGARASGPAYFVDTPVPAAPTLTSP
jgi:DsbC/DsbD-like thiol-disulfide interchange protein